MSKKANPEPAAVPEREPVPLEMDVKIHSINTSDNVLANASVTLGGCFAVRGLRIVGSEKGPFVSMPSYKTQNGYKDPPLRLPAGRRLLHPGGPAQAGAPGE